MSAVLAGAALDIPFAFPAQRGSTGVSSQASGGTFSPTIPTHQIGDLIVVVLSLVFGGGGQSGPGGWTAGPGSGPNGSCMLLSYYKVATSASEIFTFTNGNNNQITGHVYVFSGTGALDSQGSTLSADPPSLNASFGSNKTKWLAAAASSTSTGSAPSGYSGTATSTQASARLWSGTKDSQAATEDPGTTGATGQPCSFTLAIGPS